ncbi:MAG: SDR family oxidoreductase [Desulfobacterales bacterium]|nr:SDR family oxidoreductase [Desulfobacterales bacterium]
MIADFHNKTVLVTGGTQGIGLASALAFAGRGAQTVLTFSWGSADENEVRAKFAAIDAPEPLLVQADVGDDEDTAMLMKMLKKRFDRVEVFISNAAATMVVKSIDDYSERGMRKCIKYGAWPLAAYTRALGETMGVYPRYVVGMSSEGPDRFAMGYDFTAVSKAVMETLCRYLTWHLRREDIRINIVRSRLVLTESFNAVFGPEMKDFASRFISERYFIPPEEVAEAALALCSGLLDAMKGQVIKVDRGTVFSDNLFGFFDKRNKGNGGGGIGDC